MSFARLAAAQTTVRRWTQSHRILRRHASASHHLYSRALEAVAPAFPVHAADITVLNRPSQFFDALLDIISKAKSHIILSSLYIGADESQLYSALHNALKSNPALQITLHLDKLRSTRPGPDSPLLPLVSLLRAYPSRVHIHLFSPPTLPRLLKHIIPPRFNEGWGTWHIKCYAADDQVIISGANLNRSYFTDRQDRYILFRNQPRLIAYCTALLGVFAKFSYRLNLTEVGGPVLQWQNPTVSRNSFALAAHKSLAGFCMSYKERHNSIDFPVSADTIIYPYLHSLPLSLRGEYDILNRLCLLLKRQVAESARPPPLMNLTTGYFALYNQYQDLLLDTGVDCRVLVASPEANGFYNSPGVSGLIPDAYTLMEKRFWKKVKSLGKTWLESDHGASGIQLREWRREKWTYHAKGIWISSNHFSQPFLTVLGSSNFSTRSATLDTELGFVLHTRSANLQAQLNREIQNLYESSTAVDDHTWQTSERRVRVAARALVALGIKHML